MVIPEKSHTNESSYLLTKNWDRYIFSACLWDFSIVHWRNVPISYLSRRDWYMIKIKYMRMKYVIPAQAGIHFEMTIVSNFYQMELSTKRKNGSPLSRGWHEYSKVNTRNFLHSHWVFQRQLKNIFCWRSFLKVTCWCF